MSYIQVLEAPEAELLIHAGLKTYRRNLVEDLQGKRADLMSLIFGVKGKMSAGRIEDIEARAAELHDLDCRISAVDELLKAKK